MYKITFKNNVKEIIEEEEINKVELISLIQEDIQNREMNEASDIIFILPFRVKEIALIGKIIKKTIDIFHISISPIIVDKD